MKVVNKPIEMIVWFNKEGIPSPIRFRVTDKNTSSHIIKVDEIIMRNTEKLAGNKMFVFRCRSVIDNMERIYEIKYEIDTCKWMLFKI